MAPSSRTTRAIRARLEKAIETGIYADGDQLPAERQLAIIFGTARSTIRKVLNELDERKFVVRRVGSGTFVNYSGPRHQNLEDVVDLVSPMQLIETRFAVEPYMIRLATIHANQADLDRIGSVLLRMEAPDVDQNLFTQLDSEFHLELARCSRNPLIVRIYQEVNMVRLHAQWDRMKKLILSPDAINYYNKQHRLIYDALTRRDAQAAADLVGHHLEQARQDLLGVE